MSLPDVSKQAKAVTAFVVTFLAQVQVYVGQGGIAELQAITLGQWISVAILTAAAYGVVYAIPNTQPEPAARLIDPSLTRVVVQSPSEVNP